MVDRLAPNLPDDDGVGGEDEGGVVHDQQDVPLPPRPQVDRVPVVGESVAAEPDVALGTVPGLPSEKAKKKRRREKWVLER